MIQKRDMFKWVDIAPTTGTAKVIAFFANIEVLVKDEQCTLARASDCNIDDDFFDC